MIEGACLCGRVRFAVERFSSAIFKCHCSKCRKSSGGASSAAALATTEDFRWLQGAEVVREYKCESASTSGESTPGGFTRRFCPDCGSIVPQFLGEHQLFWVPAGLLESDPGIPLKQHIHVESKAPWEILDELTRKYPEGFGS